MQDTLIVKIEELNGTLSACVGFGWCALGFLAMFLSGLFIIKITLRGN